jgi:hypothetical protein
MTLRAFVIDEVCPSTKMSVIEAITANASRIPNGGALPQMGFIHCPRVEKKSAVKKSDKLKNADFSDRTFRD